MRVIATLWLFSFLFIIGYNVYSAIRYSQPEKILNILLFIAGTVFFGVFVPLIAYVVFNYACEYCMPPLDQLLRALQ